MRLLRKLPSAGDAPAPAGCRFRDGLGIIPTLKFDSNDSRERTLHSTPTNHLLNRQTRGGHTRTTTVLMFRLGSRALIQVPVQL
jgi:hypothetical protein